MDKTVKITVYGRVQGVFFRYYTQKKADSLAIVGDVRNLPSGEVTIHASGSESSINDFIAWCYRGSPASRVEKVDVQELTSTPMHNSFRIIR